MGRNAFPLRHTTTLEKKLSKKGFRFTGIYNIDNQAVIKKLQKRVKKVDKKRTTY